jgi:hypothetical protein
MKPSLAPNASASAPAMPAKADAALGQQPGDFLSVFGGVSGIVLDQRTDDEKVADGTLADQDVGVDDSASIRPDGEEFLTIGKIMRPTWFPKTSC